MGSRRDPIGVFDSGIGGISTLRNMVKLLPGENFIYYGDLKNAPYGTKSTAEVLCCVRGVVAHLLEQRIKALVIACNTATGAAAATLRKELDIPVVAMEPALKPASELRRDGKILVMATPLTLNQPKFEKLMAQYGAGAEKVPCVGLMELVEQEDEEGARKYLEGLFSRQDLDRVDAVVLGCTHYVFLKAMIREMLPEHIAITEGNEGTARQLRRVLQRADLLSDAAEGSVTFETSGDEATLETMRRWLARKDPGSGPA